MQTEQPIAIMIHDLNPWGGQDRSMLEIAWQLNKEFPLEIHSFSLQGYEKWPAMEHIQYQATIKRPIIIKYLNYHLNSWNNLRGRTPKWIQSTGTASLKSDVVQVQFIHHTWQEIAPTLPADKSGGPGVIRGTYQAVLNRYKKLLEQKVYTPEKKYIAISHSIKKELMRHFEIPSENIKIIYHGVDNEYFTPVTGNQQAQQKRQEIRKSLGIADNDFILLHVGALNARKGLFQSFKVLSHLKKNDINNVKLLAVGQGDQKVLKNLGEQHDVADRIILAPHSKDIRNYYWSADCFFFPTFYEPFGLVILEAMASGLPVVASDLAGGSELIKNGENGILFDPNARVNDIANALLPILKDENYRNELAQRGRETSLMHSWEKVGREYQKFYRQLKR